MIPYQVLVCLYRVPQYDVSWHRPPGFSISFERKFTEDLFKYLTDLKRPSPKCKSSTPIRKTITPNTFLVRGKKAKIAETRPDSQAQRSPVELHGRDPGLKSKNISSTT